MVTGSSHKKKRRGLATVEIIVAMAILAVGVMPLAYSFAQETRLFRKSYQRAVAVELVDGEMEILLAGGWRSYSPGTNNYVLRGGAATNLPPGETRLTITGRQLRLEWLPARKDPFSKVVREAAIP
jgi:Tfp pilus assembly protein PilV